MKPVLETLKTYVNLPSGSYDKHLCARMAEQLTCDLQALGMQVTAHEGKRFGPTLVAKWGSGPRQLMLMGHYDTVFPENISQPFQLVDEQRATGSGIVDMKGGLAIMVHALKEVLPQVDGTKFSVVCVLNADEEVGTGESRGHIVENARQSFAALSFEPGHGAGSYSAMSPPQACHRCRRPCLADYKRRQLSELLLNSTAYTSCRRADISVNTASSAAARRQRWPHRPCAASTPWTSGVERCTKFRPVPRPLVPTPR